MRLPASETSQEQVPAPQSSPTTPVSRLQQPADAFDVFLYLRVLLASWWIILPLTLLGAAGGHFVFKRTPPMYRANCQLEILQNYRFGSELDVLGASYRYSMIGRHIVLLRSPKLNRQVADRLAAEWATKTPTPEGALAPTVTQVGEAAMTMLNVSVVSHNHLYAKAYLEELLRSFEDIRFSEAANISEGTLQQLRDEVANYEKQVKDAEQAIRDFESTHDLLFEEKRSASQQTLLATLINKKDRLAAQRDLLDQQFPMLEKLELSDPMVLQEALELSRRASSLGEGLEDGPGQSGGNTPLFVNSGGAEEERRQFAVWQERQTQIIRLQAEFDHLLKTYRPSHPKMQELLVKLEAARRELRIAAELTLKHLKSRREALRLQEEAYARTAEKVRSSFAPQTATRAQYELLQEKYNSLARHRDSLRNKIIDLTSSQVDKTIVRRVEDPQSSARPYYPVKWKLLAAGTGAGFGFSVCLALLVFFLRSRLYDFSGLERSLGLICLAGVQKMSLSQYKRTRKVPIVLTRERDSMVNESFRNLRTSVENAMPEGARLLMVSSPDPSEGKTLLALNMAVAFSWNRNRVLILDGDFRKLSLRKAFPDAPTRGLTDLLTDSTLKINDCIVRAPVAEIAPNLDYMPAGHNKEDIAELLTLSKIRHLIKELREQYDLIIVDSAPVNRVVDTILLAKHADAVLLVAHSGKTTVPAMRYCHSRISQARILGYVLNAIDKSSSRYGYYYSSSYYSHAHYYYHSYKGYYGNKSADK
jgi:capsular exopolysaccharide synthesis family protein